MVSGSFKTGVAFFLDFRLLTPGSEDSSGMGDQCLGRGVRVSLTFRLKLSRTSCLTFIALTISTRAGCSPFRVDISGTLSLFDRRRSTLTSCNVSTVAIVRLRLQTRLQVWRVHCAMLGSPWFFLRMKATNTTGNENGRPFTENLSIDQLFYGTHSRTTYNHSKIVNHFVMLSRTTTNHINLPQQKSFTYHPPLPFLSLQIVCTIPDCFTSQAPIFLQPLDGGISIRFLPCWGILKASL